MKLFDWVFRRGCQHEWTRWGDPYSWAYDVYQRRTCTACGKIQIAKRGEYCEKGSDHNAAVSRRSPS